MKITQTTEQYTSFLAKLLLQPLFRDQWVIPHAPKYLEKFFAWYERNYMVVDTQRISIDRPIFFLSMPRCGSSMLQDILCAHPQAAYINNMMHQFRQCFCAAEYFRKRLALDVSGERFLNDSVRVSGGSPADPVGTWADWLTYDPFVLDYTEFRRWNVSSVAIANIQTDIRKVLWLFNRERSSRFICKTPGLLPHMRLLNDLFPDAKFIHLVRDARMSANSLVKLFRKTNEQLNAIRRRHKKFYADCGIFVPYPRLPKLKEYIEEFGPENIRTTASLWSDGVNYFRDRKEELSSYIEVRYEDILENPHKEIERLLDYCELPNLSGSIAPFREKIGQVGAIHHRNSYSNFEEVENICRAEMRRYGYY